jgi:hypothetical protein
MIELTEQQLQEVRKNQPTRMIDPETHQRYILLRQEVYDKLAGLLGDDTVFATADLLDKIMAEDDANDPYLADYQLITRENI